MQTKHILAIALCISTLGMFVLGYKVYNERQVVQQPPPVIDNSDDGQVTPIPEPKEHTFDEAVASITKDELKKDLYYLASNELEGRMSGKKGNVTAAKHIKERFESFGLKTEYHKFNIQRMNDGPNNERGDDFTQNIYAWIEGNDPALKDEIVVIGAHMDHIGYGPRMSRSRRIAVHPGADDNASGTVGLMEIAQAFSLLKDKVKRTVVFQAYSAEEMGLIGSRYYCNNPTFPRGNPSIKKHVFMLNMDMIGYLGKGVYFAGWHAGDSSIDVGRIIDELNRKYSFAKGITSRGSGGSDHANFYNKRIPIAFLHTGGHPHYHTPTDTPDKINYEGVEKVARYGFELAWKVVQADSAPRFNNASFKPMRVIHDHGNPEMPFIHSYHEEEWINHGRDEEHKHGHSHTHGEGGHKHD